MLVRNFSHQLDSIYWFILPKHKEATARNRWNETPEQNPGWTQQQRHESSLEIKLLFFYFHSFMVTRGVELFIYAFMGRLSLIFLQFRSRANDLILVKF